MIMLKMLIHYKVMNHMLHLCSLCTLRQTLTDNNWNLEVDRCPAGSII